MSEMKFAKSGELLARRLTSLIHHLSHALNSGSHRSYQDSGPRIVFKIRSKKTPVRECSSAEMRIDRKLMRSCLSAGVVTPRESPLQQIRLATIVWELDQIRFGLSQLIFSEIRTDNREINQRRDFIPAQFSWSLSLCLQSQRTSFSSLA